MAEKGRPPTSGWLDLQLAASIQIPLYILTHPAPHVALQADRSVEHQAINDLNPMPDGHSYSMID